MPLPENRGRRVAAPPKVHRFRSHWLELGRRLRAFRERHALTQAEVAAAVGAGAKTTVTQWETGARIPEGVLRERVEALASGRVWPTLRQAAVAADGAGRGTGAGMPAQWEAAVRWYRRASRERAVRAALGSAIAAGLDALRAVDRPEELRARYLAGGAWGSALPRDAAPAAAAPAAARRVEDAAFGLRWIELACGLRIDPSRSLVPQFSLPLLRQSAGTSGTTSG